jgi:hypothetical protein
MKLQSFNGWMNETVTEKGISSRRFRSYQPKTIPHPIILADHVWNECAKNYTLRLDSFLTQMRLMMKDDPRATSFINAFKEEMVKTMIENSVPFEPDLTPVEQDEPQPMKLEQPVKMVQHSFKLV